MGLLLTKQEARLEELNTLIDEAWEQYRALRPAAEAEKAAGIPPVGGTNQALRAAALEYVKQLYDEQNAIFNCRGVFCLCLGWGSLRAVVAWHGCFCCGGGGALLLHLRVAGGPLRAEAPTEHLGFGCMCLPVMPDSRKAGRPGHATALPRLPACLPCLLAHRPAGLPTPVLPT